MITRTVLYRGIIIDELLHNSRYTRFSHDDDSASRAGGSARVGRARIPRPRSDTTPRAVKSRLHCSVVSWGGGKIGVLIRTTQLQQLLIAENHFLLARLYKGKSNFCQYMLVSISIVNIKIFKS